MTRGVLHALRGLGARGGRAVQRVVRVEVGVRAVVADTAGIDVVLPHDARELRGRRVGGREQAQVIAVGEVDAVLGVEGRGLRRPVRRRSRRLAERERGEGLVAGLARRRDADDARLVERAVRRLDLVAALGDGEVEERAPDDGRVALAGIVGALEDADARGRPRG